MGEAYRGGRRLVDVTDPNLIVEVADQTSVRQGIQYRDNRSVQVEARGYFWSDDWGIMFKMYDVGVGLDLGDPIRDSVVARAGQPVQRIERQGGSPDKKYVL